MSMTEDVLLAVGLALVFGLAIAIAIERAKYLAAKPMLEQAEMARTALRSLMASRSDYSTTEDGAIVEADGTQADGLRRDSEPQA